MHTAIAWFTRNPVAANLLMVLLVVGGFLGAFLVNQEEFPNIDVKAVSVSVPYLGAAPEEVERAVCVRVEEATTTPSTEYCLSILTELAGSVSSLRLTSSGRKPRSCRPRVKRSNTSRKIGL